MSDLLATTWHTVVQTASYLFAYAYVLVLAPAVHLALLALSPRRRRWLEGREGPVAAVVLGLTEPLSRVAFERNLRRLGPPGSIVTYLVVSHALTSYSWILLGPLLGKDFLLSHVVGMSLFAVLATALVRLAGIPGPTRTVDTDDGGAGPGRTLAVAAIRYVLLAALGLGLGGLVAAWGLSEATRAPAELAGGGAWGQLANAGIGAGLALLAVPPVTNLFVGTYLWKVGLAHAGIVAFFCAATAAPTRWGMYSRLYGRAGAARLVAVLLAAALLAGLVTAWSFGTLDVSIRYKLIPEQLWQGA